MMDRRAAAATLAKYMVESIERAGAWENVWVGEVLTEAPMADSDHLHLCTVTTGGEPFGVVCGAPNVRAGMKAPTALVDAQLPPVGDEGTQVRVSDRQPERADPDPCHPGSAARDGREQPIGDKEGGGVYPIEDEANVNKRRAEVGLPPLGENLETKKRNKPPQKNDKR